MVEQLKTNTEPYVRFRGFDDEWEQVKLGDVLSYEQPTKYIVDSDNYDDSFITPVLTAGKSFLLGYTDETDGVYDNGNVILFDDFTTATQLVDFEFKVKSSAMKLLTPIAENNINFLYETLNLIRYPHDDHKRYWISEYATLKVKTPSSLPEQQKIGELFQTLDNVIDLSNTQVENLKQQKKALLQRLFPQKGETEPKVRLRGFTDEWNEVTLGDVLSIPDKQKVEVESADELLTLKLHLGGLYRGSGQTLSLGSTVYYKRSSGQLIYGKQNLFNGSMAIIPDEFDGLCTSGDVPTLDINMDRITPTFLYQYMSRRTWYEYLEVYASGTGSKRIHEHELFKIKATIPSLEEQQAIGELFQTLDEQIRLAEDKVSQYKELKQALLQRLFV